MYHSHKAPQQHFRVKLFSTIDKIHCSSPKLENVFGAFVEKLQCRHATIPWSSQLERGRRGSGTPPTSVPGSTKESKHDCILAKLWRGEVPQSERGRAFPTTGTQKQFLVAAMTWSAHPSCCSNSTSMACRHATTVTLWSGFCHGGINSMATSRQVSLAVGGNLERLENLSCQVTEMNRWVPFLHI